MIITNVYLISIRQMTNAQYKDNELKCLNTMFPNCEGVKFNIMEVIDAIKALKSGKGTGLDKLQAEHFKFANVEVLSCLCYLMLHLIMDTYHRR